MKTPIKTIAKSPKSVAVYTRRDSATTALRKIGVTPSRYNDFIEVNTLSDGSKEFTVDIDRAKSEFTSQVVEQKVLPEQVAAVEEVKVLRQQLESMVKKAKDKELGIKFKKPDPVITNPVRKPKEGEKCAEYCRAAILCGHNNYEIFTAIKEYYGHGDDKKNYPAWYRHKMREAGIL